MIVADTNVVAYFVIAGENTAHAEAVRSRDADWRVPGLFINEWLNVVTLHVLKKMLERDEAVRAYRRGLSLVRVHGGLPDPVRIINLHAASGCSSYDCQFIALAEDLGTRLVTADQQVVKAFPNVAADLTQF